MIRTLLHKVAAIMALGVVGVIPAMGEVTFDYSAGATINAGGGKFAPYYMASMRGGTVTQPNSALVSATLGHEMDTTRRFSWGCGVEVWGGYASSTKYERYDEPTGTWRENSQHPPRLWLQQLHGEVKWRGVFLMLGMKRYGSYITNDELSSGDLVLSANARPAPGVRAGFVNYQTFPGTKGWLQVIGEVAYYKMNDTKWLENHFNYYNKFLTTGIWFHYKSIYFRSNPNKPFVVTLGTQSSCQFGGLNRTYVNGVVTNEIKMDVKFKTFVRTIFAGRGGNNPGDVFAEGNHLGTIDLCLEYKFRNGSKIKGYLQAPWEDGSGLKKANGIDGLWGLEYNSGKPALLRGAVLEFISLKNQSGPLHFNANDYGGSPIEGKATGCDDYYNNYTYNGYAAFGMSLGSPFVRSPLYNTDGYMAFTDNLVRGFHLGLAGDLTKELSYRALVSYRKSWGTPFVPRLEPVHDTSVMIEAAYRPMRVSGLSVKLSAALDRGNLYGDNTGAMLTVNYSGDFTIR